MSRLLGLVGFGTVATLISCLMHWYVYVRLVRDARLPGRWPQLLGGMILVMAVLMPLSMMMGRSLPPGTVKVLTWPVFVWMGAMMWLVLSVMVVDLVRLALKGVTLALGTPEVLGDPQRRLLLQRMASGAVAVTTAGLSTVAVRKAAQPLTVKDVPIELSKLPPPLHGLTVAQITDVHVGLTVDRAYVERVVHQTNLLKPDVVAITGDLVDGSVAQLGPLVEPLKDLTSRHGVYFVTGNHEYFSGVEEWIKELERLGIHVLRNERVSIGQGSERFDLAGIHDFSAARFAPEHAPNLVKALEGRDRDRELVLLAHQPRAVEEAARMGVGLQLSGHTHGGQIWPWGHLVSLQQRWVQGLFTEGNTQLYVSPGTGYWGPPMRLGTQSEITKVILQSPLRMA